MAKFKSEAPHKRPRHDPLAVQLGDDRLGSGKLSAPGRRTKRKQERGQEVSRPDTTCIIEVHLELDEVGSHHSQV